MQATKPAVQPLVRIEAHYRAFLARRWLALIWRAALVASMTVATGVYFSTSFQISSIPVSMATTLLVFPFTIYPILWARRSFITSPTKLPASTTLTSSIISTASSPRYLHLIGSYLICGAVFGGLYCQLVNWFKPASDLGLWSATARHPWHLNERFIFLTLGNTLIFTILGVREILNGSLTAIWPTRRAGPFSKVVQDTLLNSIPAFDNWNAFTLSQSFAVGYTFIYFVARKWTWRFLATHFAGLIRPFIINFTKSSRNNTSWSLLPHLSVLQLITLVAIAVPVEVLMVYVTQPLAFDTFTRKSPLSPDQYLMTALKSENAYYQHFTLMELLRISHNPSRRQAIFSDISKTTPLTLAIWQELLLIIGKTQNTLITRNASSTRPTPAARPPMNDPRSIPIKQADIFKPITKQKSGISLALQNVLEGTPRSIPPAPVMKVGEAALAVKSKAVLQIEDAQKMLVGKIQENASGKVVLYEAMSIRDKVYAWVGRDWATRRLGSVLPDIWQAERAIEILTVLAVASIEEDTYGHVQQVLPATLEIIVRFRQALLAFESELLGQATLLGRAQDSAGRTTKLSIIEVTDTCETSIRRIADRFGSSLSAFRFPPMIGQALSDICRPEENDEQR